MNLGYLRAGVGIQEHFIQRGQILLVDVAVNHIGRHPPHVAEFGVIFQMVSDRSQDGHTYHGSRMLYTV